MQMKVGVLSHFLFLRLVRNWEYDILVFDFIGLKKAYFFYLLQQDLFLTGLEKVVDILEVFVVDQA